MIVDSLAKVGAARSIVIDEDNIVRAGNGVVAAAGEAGIKKLRIIDTDGTTLIAIRRRNLTPEQKRELAMFDNRAGELAEWNAEQLGADAAAGLALAPYFEENELAKLLKSKTPHEATVVEVDTADVQDRFWIAIAGPLKSQAVALQRLREVMRDVEGVQVELGTVPIETWG